MLNYVFLGKEGLLKSSNTIRNIQFTKLNYFWQAFFLTGIKCCTVLQINIPLPVTINRNIKKPLVKLNFRQSHENNE